MRRSVLFSLIFLLLVTAALFLLVVGFGAGSNAISLPALLSAFFPTSTPNMMFMSPTAVPIFSTPLPSRTPTLTPSPTATPTLDILYLQATAAVYATAHAPALGELVMLVEEGRITRRVTFSEEEVNALITPYVADVPNASNVHLDLIPDGATLSADLTVIGLNMAVTAAAQLTVQDGRIGVDVTDAAIGGITPPAAALDAVNDTLIPMVNEALETGLAEYGSPEQREVVAVQAIEDGLTVDFVIHDAAPVP